jgi:hypothetical protein
VRHARAFAEAIHAVYPDKMLAYNLSPSFNWDSTGMGVMSCHGSFPPRNLGWFGPSAVPPPGEADRWQIVYCLQERSCAASA